MNRLFFITLLSFYISLSFAQDLKRMGPEVFDIWKTIQRKQISNDGNWVVYQTGNEAGDTQLNIYNAQTGSTVKFDRGYKAKISNNSEWLVFQVQTSVDTIKALKHKKIDKDKFPKDSLVIYNLQSRSVSTIENVQSFQLPKNWDNWVVYKKAFIESKNENQDTPPAKKEDGTLLFFYDLQTKATLSYPGSQDYTVAEDAPNAIFSNSGKFGGFDAGIYQFDFKEKKAYHLFKEKGKYYNLSLDKTGSQASFTADLDTTEQRIRPFSIYHWNNSTNQVSLIERSIIRPESTDFIVSKHYKPHFSKDGQTLFYGVAPLPILQDTGILKEDIVNVEVWHYQDTRLYTQQEKNLDDDQKKTHLKSYNTKTKQTQLLTNESISDFILADEGNATEILAINDQPYYRQAGWEGFPAKKDIYLINKNTGQKRTVAKAIKTSPNISPKGKFLYWFDIIDTAWYAYHIPSTKTVQLTDNKTVPFYDELNDRPMRPYSHRAMGWSKDEESFFVYDKYDIWQINPKTAVKKRITNGRTEEITYRYLDLDREERAIDTKGKILLHFFNHKDMSSGYALLDLQTGVPKILSQGDYKYSAQAIKARDKDAIIFQKENFATFPNLLLSDLSISNPKTISDVNPQQKEYGWGSIELVKWTDDKNITHQGMLVKPPNFNPKKKYPMIVNFYERSSKRLHNHIIPYPHRSTINYSYYANRGYLIFNPDITYRIGYPGDSAYDIVMSGTQAMIDKGFVDKKNIGLQGHSWGGYQIAYITTKTDLFKCAESGAPVVNMFSAYGGIRWGSGLSRMFQYEHTQSRIGGTIWNSYDKYLENSPLFELDQVNTPILILHNDQDGAVPWYQGIEYFVGLRRLNKPAWLLNYNGEPHWPLKRPNRLDFNIRLAQFFDHYLQGSPMPKWMKQGVPAIEKGIRQGLETDY